jgi:hypothetical protein
MRETETAQVALPSADLHPAAVAMYGRHYVRHELQQDKQTF